MPDRIAERGYGLVGAEGEEDRLLCPTTALVRRATLVEEPEEPLCPGYTVPVEVRAVPLVVPATTVEIGPERASTCPLTGPEDGPDHLRAVALQSEAAGPVPRAAAVAVEAVVATRGVGAASAAVVVAVAATAGPDAAPAAPGA